VKTAVGMAAAFIFAVLGSLHGYWAAGGRVGSAAAVPQGHDGAPLFRPGRATTVAVGLALWTAAAVLLARVRDLDKGHSAMLPRAGCLLLAVVFLARAVGDFRFIGLFKKRRSTRFAAFDSWVYTPLCLFLAAGCLLCGL
jgi:uncharacterized protein DUF3995